jgi:restriction system protein
MARRGFFAEIQHQTRVAAREGDRQARARAKEHAAAVRRAEQARRDEEQARRADERAMASNARMAEADRKRMEKEAKARHVAAMEASVEVKNAELAQLYDEIDSLLETTLDVDDYVDLEALRRTVQHPPFDRASLEAAIPPPSPIPEPIEPTWVPPDPPRGLFWRRRKHAKAVAAAEAAFADAHAAWEFEIKRVGILQEASIAKHAQAEKDRMRVLKTERTRYEAECAARKAKVAEYNAKIDTLITNLSYGAVEAVQEYVSIVLSNSVYPDHFPVEHEFVFDPSTAELRLRVLVPPPSALPEIKSYKYTKSSDEVLTAPLSQKERKDRYSRAIQHVALRSLHEVFEADRRGIIKTISLQVGTETTIPATGRVTYVPFIAVAAERDAFLGFDLSAVVPAATLEHLGAAISKNPYAILPADVRGIRRL